jgi:hypothetical protein
MGHRYKVYAAETGASYQYFFVGARRVTRPEGQGTGSDYLFVVTPNQQPPFVLRVFVAARAQAVWQHLHGRELDPNEVYAAAKMRLFRAFDELDEVRTESLNLLVDETNIEALLAPLDL